jgi:hypothetical protein
MFKHLDREQRRIAEAVYAGNNASINDVASVGLLYLILRPLYAITTPVGLWAAWTIGVNNEASIGWGVFFIQHFLQLTYWKTSFLFTLFIVVWALTYNV